VTAVWDPQFLQDAATVPLYEDLDPRHRTPIAGAGIFEASAPAGADLQKRQRPETPDGPKRAFGLAATSICSRGESN
jgi:hypothetical protein